VPLFFVSLSVGFRYLVNVVMFGSSAGLTLTTRSIKRWDQPRMGMLTYSMFPWDLVKNCPDTNHKLLSIKTGTIAPHPTLPGKSVMTTLEINGMGGMPTFALNFITRVTAPQMMRSLESRYIANARKKGDFVDMVGGSGRGKSTWRTSGEGKEDEGKSARK